MEAGQEAADRDGQPKQGRRGESEPRQRTGMGAGVVGFKIRMMTG